MADKTNRAATVAVPVEEYEAIKAKAGKYDAWQAARIAMIAENDRRLAAEARNLAGDLERIKDDTWQRHLERLRKVGTPAK